MFNMHIHLLFYRRRRRRHHLRLRLCLLHVCLHLFAFFPFHRIISLNTMKAIPWNTKLCWNFGITKTFWFFEWWMWKGTTKIEEAYFLRRNLSNRSKGYFFSTLMEWMAAACLSYAVALVLGCQDSRSSTGGAILVSFFSISVLSNGIHGKLSIRRRGRRRERRRKTWNSAIFTHVKAFCMPERKSDGWTLQHFSLKGISLSCSHPSTRFKSCIYIIITNGMNEPKDETNSRWSITISMHAYLMG